MKSIRTCSRPLLLIAMILLMLPLRGISQEKIKVKNDTMPTALLIIDIQAFYFPGGKLPLKDPEKAAANASVLLKLFRDQRLPVIHVQHKGGGEIDASVKPLKGEKVITKTEANSFNGTDLQQYLQFLGVRRLVICGMQTQMCVEAATRAAYDEGFSCIVVQDACTTHDLKWGDLVIPEEMVHASTLASLDRFYAKVVNTSDLQ
jgi:nicotinamidase-related amidase